MYCSKCSGWNPATANACATCGTATRDMPDAVTEGLASILDRFCAAVGDAITMFMVYLFIVMSVVGFSDFINEGPSTWEFITISTMSFVAYFAINGYLLAKNGQTLGKYAVGIKIVRTNRQKASFWRLVGLRILPISLVSAIPMVGGLILIVDALFIFRKEHNCLHDDLADTRVVKS